MSDSQNINETQFTDLISLIKSQSEQIARLEEIVVQKSISASDMVACNPHFRRNFLFNDHAAVQKNLVATWRLLKNKLLSNTDLMESGFRVFSQNDEDGILLRLFSHIGHTNRYVIEIGSNCADSDVGIPENLSANLIVNHGWHGTVMEMDQVECEHMQYFFAREHATRHFHWIREGINTYFSPRIIQKTITPENINDVLNENQIPLEPDLLIVDIDGGDYALLSSINFIKPRVVVVEFEKRFRDELSVVQPDRNNFSKRWQQSGTTSLKAWEKLMKSRGYVLCAIGGCGFNAFFVRSEIVVGKLIPLTTDTAFDQHPIFGQMEPSFWLRPDETWIEV